MNVCLSDFCYESAERVRAKAQELLGDTNTNWKYSRFYGCFLAKLFSELMTHATEEAIVTDQNTLNVDAFTAQCKSAISNVINIMTSNDPHVYETSDITLEKLKECNADLLAYAESPEFVEVSKNFIGFKPLSELGVDGLSKVIFGKYSPKLLIDSVTYHRIPDTKKIVYTVRMFGIEFSDIVECSSPYEEERLEDYAEQVAMRKAQEYLTVVYNYLMESKS